MKASRHNTSVSERGLDKSEKIKELLVFYLQ